jgi:hypothetical protein
VDGARTPASRIDVEGGWAISADLGAVFLTAFGAAPLAAELTVNQLDDLDDHPMPTETDEAYFAADYPEGDGGEAEPIRSKPPTPAHLLTEPTAIDDFPAYLDARFPCGGYGPVEERADGSVHYACECGAGSGWFPNEDAATEALDAHLDQVERDREALIVDWFSRHHPDVPVHINGVRRR